MRTIVILVAVAMFATSCVTTSREMKSWIGKPETELLIDWGAPFSTQKLADGRIVHTWKTVWGKRDDVRTCLQTFTISANKEIEEFSYDGCQRAQPIW